MKTWLTGSGRSGLRRRALTRRSVISESLGKSTVLSVDGFGEFEGVGGIFFILEFPSKFKKPLTHAVSHDCLAAYKGEWSGRFITRKFYLINQINEHLPN